MQDIKIESVPAVSTAQMREVDRLMEEDYGIQLIQMMELAGRNLAELSRIWLDGDLAGKRIAVLCGAGGNGGGGMSAAPQLANWGAAVEVVLAAEAGALKPVSAHQWAAVQRLGLARTTIALDEADLILDALLGYGAQGDPRAPIADWIEAANASGAPILALDAPSGLDTNSGRAGNPSIRAQATMTLALPKTGLLSEEAKEIVGDLFLADIGVPPQLYAEKSLGLSVPDLFGQGSLVRLV
ncbi:MAG: NAD(P)H-hydrate epimerase [Chloroflexi bacterium]|nr:NAD(P)H-hydrate epimerase [Chloroflexota bacterium]